MVRSRLLGLIGSIVSLTFVFDISNIPRVSITDRVGDDLGTAIGKSHAVLSGGSITITVLILSKVGARVVISDSITILVDSGAIISRLMVSRCWVSGLVSGSWVDNGGLVDNWGRFVDRGGLVDNRGGVVDWGRFVGRGGVVDRSGVVDGSMGMVDSMGKSVSMVSKGMMSKSMVTMGGGMDGEVARGVDSGTVLLLVVVLVNLIGGGSGLGVYS